MKMIEQLKAWAIEQVIWAETQLKDKSGAEKKAAVVKKLDEFVKLPAYLEWADDLFFSWLVDTVCEKLNAMTEHNFMALKLNAEQEQELAKEL